MSTHIPRHPIRVVAERTGLTPATLRAWERRYHAVAPRRSDGAQRLYSDGDIQRLRLIARLAAVGYPLAELSKAATAELARMADGSLDEDDGAADEPARLQAARASATVTRMMSDTHALDAATLRHTLTQSVLTLGPTVALDHVVSPFLHQVGVAWSGDEMSIAQEHLASGVVRDVLGWLLQNTGAADDAPAVVATTVAGELHEFGAMMAGITAALAGWRVIYLGPNLPAAEVVRAAKLANARVVALGIVNDQTTGSLRHEVVAMRKGLGRAATIVGGGAGTAEHQLTLRRSGIQMLATREELRATLGELWSREL